MKLYYVTGFSGQRLEWLKLVHDLLVTNYAEKCLHHDRISAFLLNRKRLMGLPFSQLILFDRG